MKKLMLLVTITVAFCAVGCRPAVEPGPERGMFLTAQWLIAKGAPDASAGVDGDLYLDTETTELYVKADGVWVNVAVLQGAAGITGAGWLVGTGAPGESLGQDGDLYLDTESTTAYVKSDGTWTELFALQGEPGSPGSPGLAGTDGATWFTGSGDPNNFPPPDATVDDLYLDTETAIIYKNTGSGWSPIVYFQALGTPRTVLLTARILFF